MVVDAECGMPLDLGKWEALWEDGADDHGKKPYLTFLKTSHLPPPHVKSVRSY